MVLKNMRGKEEEIRSWGVVGDPAHKVYNVYVLLCFVKIKGEKGQNRDLARKAI